MGHNQSRSGVAQLDGLTSLRFFAAFWVVLYHSWPYFAPGLPPILSRGELGVELFFVLSGFVLAHVYFDVFGSGRFSYGQFLWARLARIYPVHLVLILGLLVMVLGAAALGLPVGDNVVVLASLPAQLTLTQSWGLGMEGGWNFPAWSISAEWFAYLIFPLCMVVFSSVKTRPVLALGLSSLFLLIMSFGFERLSGQALTKATLAWGPVRILPCFVFGNDLWLVYRARFSGLQNHSRLLALGFMLLALILVALGVHDSLCTLALGGVILSVAHLPGRGTRMFSSRALVTLGEASFALYMVNIVWTLVFVHGLKKLVPGLDVHALPFWAFVVMVLGNIPAALILHFGIERPAQAYLRRLYDTRVVPWRSRLRLKDDIRPGFPS